MESLEGMDARSQQRRDRLPFNTKLDSNKVEKRVKVNSKARRRPAQSKALKGKLMLEVLGASTSTHMMPRSQKQHHTCAVAEPTTANRLAQFLRPAPAGATAPSSPPRAHREQPSCTYPADKPR